MTIEERIQEEAQVNCLKWLTQGNPRLSLVAAYEEGFAAAAREFYRQGWDDRGQADANVVKTFDIQGSQNVMWLPGSLRKQIRSLKCPLEDK